MPPRKRKNGPGKTAGRNQKPEDVAVPAVPAEPDDATKPDGAVPPAEGSEAVARPKAKSKNPKSVALASKLPQAKKAATKAAKTVGIYGLDTDRDMKKDSFGKDHSNSSGFVQGFRRSLEVWMRTLGMHHPDEVRENKWAIRKGIQNVVQIPNASQFGPSLL